jgi:hypothetical protein
MRTRIRFDNDRTFELRESAATAFAGYATSSGWSFRAALGSLLDGALEDGQSMHDIAPGIVGAIGVSRHWLIGDGDWFVTGSAGLSMAAASTQQRGSTDRQGLVAGDLRIGAIAGRTFAKLWNPYVLARGFGGPVWWNVDGADTIGSDTRHFQLGAGLSVVTPFGLTAVVDLSVLGEQAASFGASWRL